MITRRKNGSHSKTATDETIITKHSIITSAARNNKDLMENSNIFDLANQVIRKRTSPQTQKKVFLPSYKEKKRKTQQENIKKVLPTQNKKSTDKISQQTIKKKVPEIPSVGQGNSNINRTSIHFQF